jgi:pantetheine-phosphate adenylyltransferase
MKSLAIYPGTFDPLTLGHVDLMKRAARLFKRVIIAITARPRKATLFTAEERLAMAKKLASQIPNLEAEVFDGLLVDYVRKKGAGVIIRGLRAFSDFEYEFQMALTNRQLAPDIETLFMMPKDTLSYISSTLVREVAALGGDTSKFVPDFVQSELKKKIAAVQSSQFKVQR